MATSTSQLIEQRLPDNQTGDIDPAAVRAVAHALDAQPPNQRRGGPFFVTYLTHAAAVAAGQPTAASLDQLEAGLLCLGAVAHVARHPDQAGQVLVLATRLLASAPEASPGAGLAAEPLLAAGDGSFSDAPLVPAQWVKPESAALATANVPLYAGNVSHAVGDLVRYPGADQVEGFYYALASGYLPAPTGQAGDANWRRVAPPLPATTFYQALSLPEARGLAAGAAPGDAGQLVAPRPVAGRLYGIALPAGPQGQARTYYTWGLAGGTFDLEGTLNEAGELRKGSLALATGEFTPRELTGSGPAPEQAHLVEIGNDGSRPYADLLLRLPANQMPQQLRFEALVNATVPKAQVLKIDNSAWGPIRTTDTDLDGDLNAAYLVGATTVLVRFTCTPLDSSRPAYLLLRTKGENVATNVYPHVKNFLTFGGTFQPYAIQESDPALRYSAGWQTYVTSAAYGNSCFFTTTAGAWYEVTVPNGATNVVFEGYADQYGGGFTATVNGAPAGSGSMYLGSGPGLMVYYAFQNVQPGDVLRLTANGTCIADQISFY